MIWHAEVWVNQAMVEVAVKAPDKEAAEYLVKMFYPSADFSVVYEGEDEE